MSAGSREAWDQAHATYQARLALYDAENKFGSYHRANLAHKISAKEMERLYGPHWTRNPKAVALHAPEWEALCRAEDANWRDYGSPMNDAMAALLRTPAPDFDAIRLKIELFATYDFAADEVGRDGVDVIAEDVERLTGVRIGGEA